MVQLQGQGKVGTKDGEFVLVRTSWSWPCLAVDKDLIRVAVRSLPLT